MALQASTNTEIAIKDACILFDLVDLNLLKEFFRLDFDVFTTPQVIDEITDEKQWQEISKCVSNNLLMIDSFGEFEAIFQMTIEYRGLSATDCSVLELAIRRNAVIFSSDGGLRKVAIKQKIVVRGVLWIIEELYRKEIITVELALEKLNKYSVINRRAPIKEIDILIRKLSMK